MLPDLNKMMMMIYLNHNGGCVAASRLPGTENETTNALKQFEDHWQGGFGLQGTRRC